MTPKKFPPNHKTMPKVKETTLFIDLNALEHNFNFIKSKISKNTKVMAVVKAFAYGTDSCAIAKKLESLDVDYFAVAYAKEGVVLRESGISKPILVLHPQSVYFESIIDYHLEPNLYSFFTLKTFIEIAKTKATKHYPVHLKFNTGLNRLGFSYNDIDKISEIINSASEIKLNSILSHLAASEDPNEIDFTKSQIERFKDISERIEKVIETPVLRHLCNTSGILNYPEAHFDMVRSGIGLHGYGNSPEIDKQLKPVATLKTIISQIHNLKPGESLGYNRGFKATQPTRTATLPIGHADGISRLYGKGKGVVFINNKPAPILGNVCMDMIMVDVTNIDCNIGDEVIIFGAHHSAEIFANNAQTISYELLTALSQRIKRVIIS